MRSRLAALATGIALVAALGGPGAAGAALPAGNLLQDPGAEQAVGGAISGWTLRDGFAPVDYGNPGGFPSAAESARVNGGKFFFSGGKSAASTAAQAVDVSAAAAEIDAGGVTAKLSAWLGGFEGQGDRMSVTATFLGASGNALGTVALKAVTPAERKGQTVFVARAAAATVPAGTRSISVLLAAVRDSGTWSDGSADNLSLTLVGRVGAGGGASTGKGGSTGTNVLSNPGAEEFAGGQLRGWTLKNGFTAVDYGNTGGFPTAADSARLGGGRFFFSGGQSNRSTATQTVDVSGQASAIDRGTLVATLSGLVGGFASQADQASVTATFLGASGNVLGSVKIGPVTVAQRKGVTSLLSRKASASVPIGSRSISVVILSVRSSGSWNDGSADKLSLTLGTGAGVEAGGGAAAGSAGVADYRASAAAICTRAKQRIAATIAKIRATTNPDAAAARLDTLLDALQPLLPEFKALVPPPEFAALHVRLMRGLDTGLATYRRLIALMASKDEALVKARAELAKPFLKALTDIQAGFNGMGLTACERVLESSVPTT